MKNIYGETLTAVSKGATYSVNLEQKNLKVDGKYIIKNGEYEGSLGVFCYEQDAISWLEEKYRLYKNSTPNEASEKRRTYFKALEYKELSDDDLLYGISRNYAQCDLELLLLCLILSGIFKWDEETMGKWFWQSKNEPDFVILKKWVESIGA